MYFAWLSYEDVWIPRLGYEPEEYESAISAALERVGAGPR